MSAAVAFLFFELLVIATINISSCNGSTYVRGCIESERQTLLNFKQDLKDPSNRLASWNGDGDCCKWDGVVCNNLTGHILELHLRNPFSDDDYEAHQMSKLVGNYLNISRQFVEEATLSMRGALYEYKTILNLVRLIDLSKNNFSGEIPLEVTSLATLHSLNLSHNLFTGRIPPSIGTMTSLESLDLSANHFCGEIPLSMSNLTFLGYLNLSKNNFIGKIPLGVMLQSFDPSSFMGNELCGPPLSKQCKETIPTSVNSNGRGKVGNENEVDWFYMSLALSLSCVFGLY